MRGNERELYTTSITLAEIGYGIERLADGRRKDLLRSTAQELFPDFARAPGRALGGELP